MSPSPRPSPRSDAGRGRTNEAPRRAYGVIVVGVSAGGLNALSVILPALPEGFPLPLVIVHHMKADAGNYLPLFLNQRAPLPVKEAEEMEAIRPGTVHIAPPGYHLLIEMNRTFSLSIDPPVSYSRPSIDVLFECAADTYGDRAVGVILTGANTDGAAGLRRIKECGGLTIVQDPDTAHSSRMPKAALRAVDVDHVLPLRDIGPLLARLSAPPLSPRLESGDPGARTDRQGKPGNVKG